jgi:hypothetical protein
MFRKNDTHLQPPLFSEVQSLSDKVRQRLKESWADVFYQECFSRINEERFAILYTDKASRPNVPVNILVGLECLKAGFGWSDEEMYDQFLYNIQVRYALGLHELNSSHFELRTVYNFRRRLVQYRQETEIDLVGNIFAEMTGEQIAAFKVRTGMQRMDSSQISSDMADLSRLQLVAQLFDDNFKQTATAAVVVKANNVDDADLPLSLVLKGRLCRSCRLEKPAFLPASLPASAWPVLPSKRAFVEFVY